MEVAQPSSAFWKRFLFFLLPLIATNILQSLSGTINTVFVGQMMGVDAIAAVAVFFPILFTLLAFIIGLSAGCTVLIGQAWGARDHDKLQRIIGSTLFMTLIGGTLIAIFGVYFAEELLRLLGTDDEIMHLSLPFVQWMLAGSPLIFLYIIYTSIIRGVGDSVTPMIALGLTSIVGLIVTPTLIKGYFGFPQLGIIAPAIATILGYLLVLIFLFFYMKVKNHPLKVDMEILKQIRHQPKMSKLILRLSVPTGIQMVTTSIAGLVIVGLVNRFGSEATAAYGAVNQVLNYIQFPAISISIAASIFAAQAIGSNHADAVTRVTRTALAMNIALTGSLILIGYLASKYLMALFITEPHVIELGQQLLFIVLWSILFFGASGVFVAIMRASGHVIQPMLINVACILLIEVPLAYLFSRWWGLEGIWYGYATAFVFLFIFQGLYYQFVWKRKTIHRLI